MLKQNQSVFHQWNLAHFIAFSGKDKHSRIPIKNLPEKINSVHGIDTIENNVSGYYVADEISGIYRGMMIAIPDNQRIVFQQMSIPELTGGLGYPFASNIDHRHGYCFFNCHKTF